MTRLRRWKGILAAVLAAGLAVHPDRAIAGSDTQTWLTANASVDLNPKWKLSQELTLRFKDESGLSEVEASTLIGRAIDKSIGVWVGYTNFRTYSGSLRGVEDRLREQVTFDNFLAIGRGSLSGRMRLEQRWSDKIDGTGWRVRPFIRFSLPLKSGMKPSLVLSNELFVNFNRTQFQPKPGLERSRTFAGISLPVTKQLKVEVGYLNQYTILKGKRDDVNHILSVAVSQRL